MGKASQTKGKRGEEELSEILQEYGYPVERSPSQNYGTAPDIVGLPGVHVEVKRVEKLNIDLAMQQAITDSERFHDGIPIVFHRKNRKPWLVTLRLSDFMKIFKGE